MVHSPSTTQGSKAPRLQGSTLFLYGLRCVHHLRDDGEDGERRRVFALLRSEIGIEMEPHGQTFHMLNIFIFDFESYTYH